MKKFKFEIQSLIKVTVEGHDRDDARNKLCMNLEEYKDELISNPCVSDGEEVK